MTTQRDVYVANIAAAQAQQTSNTANAVRQNANLGLQITTWQDYIYVIDNPPVDDTE